MIAEFKNVDVVLDKHTILRNLSWSIPSGRVIGLLGKNGAGKSTLIRSLLGLILPACGSVSLFNVDPREMGDTEKMRLAYVPQTATGYEGLKVSRALSIHSSCYPRWDGELAGRMLERFHIDTSTKVEKLSVGQRQSLMLVFALASQPELLVMDEPVASLDPSARREVLQFITEVAGSCTILYSTHITADITRLADDIAVLADGQIQICRPSEEVAESVLLSGAIPESLKQNTAFKQSVLAEANGEYIVAPWNSEFDECLSGDVLKQNLNLEEFFIRWHAISANRA